jgi:glycosyltransferase involved in cell wall biosynthesis
MNIKVSVVVPIYNAGPYLKSCLDSLKSQTLQDMEFILVLDCPTDESDSIAESYANADSRFVIVHNTENLHIGESRNRGIDEARGEYIGFCDHDDYCRPEMFETLYAAASRDNADVCLSFLWHRYGRNGENNEYFQFPSVAFDSSSAADAIIASYPMKRDVPSYNNIRSVWLQILKTAYVRKNGIRFVDTKQSTFEDIYYCANEFLFNPRVTVIPEYFYCWISNSESASNTYAYLSPDKVVRFNEELYELLVRSGNIDRYYSAMGCCLVRRMYTMFVSGGGIRTIGALWKSDKMCLFTRDISRHFYRIKGLPPTKWAYFWAIMFPLSCMKKLSMKK